MEDFLRILKRKVSVLPLKYTINNQRMEKELEEIAALIEEKLNDCYSEEFQLERILRRLLAEERKRASSDQGEKR
ncbi:hypothetical protein [Shouchella shacheensis]|uniref:hypothetical protein n=1 Tax=Shouchella shacheensis TaxID=1649580 RepID=UPI0007401ECD|nr:hypothetical protein [Shouchella shacheensis]